MSGIVSTPSRHTFECDGTQRVFPIPSNIIAQDYVRMEIDGVLVSNRREWDVVNNSIVFVTAPLAGLILDVQVASDVESIGELGMLANVDIVAQYINNVNATGSNIEDVVNVSNNLNIVSTGFEEVRTVAQNITDVNIVSDNIFNVNKVADMDTQINTLYTDRANINTVAQNITDVNIVSDKTPELVHLSDNINKVDDIALYSTQIQIVGNDLANSYEFIDDYGLITDVVTNEPQEISNIETVATNIDAIINTNTFKDEIIVVGTNISDINTVAGIDTDVTKVANIDLDVTKVANIDSVVPTVANIDTDVTKVADIDLYVVKVANIDLDVTKVANIDSDVSTVASINTKVTIVADNILDVQNAEENAVIAKEEAWRAEAERLTANSYATEPEDVYVKIYTSNNDGTFTITNTSDYSAYHWERKATSLVITGVIDDDIISEEKVYSNSKVVELLEGKLDDNNGVIDLGSITDIVE